MRLASYHLAGNVQIWLQRMKVRKKDLDLQWMKDKLFDWFSSSLVKDVFEELYKLKLTTSL